ncbi:MAG: 16S rRNA (uracil(1498)-N(3))-methyltransferase [Tissierellia bacterium]|nr:16S rRNA (uracil(1498)-N(3))-methyltransferase [Tissierellia bacterium]
MHRIFTDKEIDIKENYIVDKEDYNHIVNSLRMREGEEVEIASSNAVYLSIIETIGNKSLELKIIKSLDTRSESDIKIILYQAFAKGDKMDLIIQKAVELGVYEISPINTKRTVVRLDEKRMKKKVERFNIIAKSSAQQSRRDYIPKVNEMIELDQIDEKNLLLAYENENEVNLKDVLKSCDTDRIGIVIGPEGGFEEDEVEALKLKGAKIISMGPRILRTETAAISMISLIQYELGDMGA